MFKKVILSLIFIFYFSGFVFTQTEKYSAPVTWERYKINEKDVSVLLPKRPVLITKLDICARQDTQMYSAYAAEVAYTLKITSKFKAIRKFCPQEQDFDEDTFAARVKELHVPTEKIEKYSQNGREVSKIKNELTTYWLFNDFENKRWYELWVTHRDDIKPETKEFIESIRFERAPKGIEIGEGSNRTFGDWTEKLTDSSEKKDDKKIEEQGAGGGSGSGIGLGSGSGIGIGGGTGRGSGLGSGGTSKENLNADKKDIYPILVVQRPQARYTDAARENNVQGTVTLKVTFMANGGIGAISPASGLPYGLTEQAIAAAAKIVFIPAKRNGVTVTTSKTVVYSFTIY